LEVRRFVVTKILHSSKGKERRLQLINELRTRQAIKRATELQMEARTNAGKGDKLESNNMGVDGDLGKMNAERDSSDYLGPEDDEV
jgi:hypothetical protein